MMSNQDIIIAEYIWIDSNNNIRSKTRTLKKKQQFIIFPEWNFDGSSTDQAEVKYSDIILKPVASFKDSLRSKKFKNFDCYLVLCDCYKDNGKPIESNSRYKSNIILNAAKKEELWFGFEQEYILINADTRRIVGWPLEGFPEAQGKYYCGNGADRSFHRDVVEKHFKKCLDAGINICGINEEVFPGQWEFQIGPCEGISVADHLWIARYLLIRICEKKGLLVSFDPKPYPNWNGQGLHTNISTQKIREVGLDAIYEVVKKLEKKHLEHLEVYGDNSKRLNGSCETSSREKFTIGIGDRTSSIRIPTSAMKDGNYYFEDRRIASDADPYKVIGIITETINSQV